MFNKMETIVLPKMETPNRPINIAADPRVFRGSIIAKHREAIKQIQQEIEARQADEKWKASVVQNKLSLALGAANLMGAGRAASPSEIPLGYRIARLNGPIGRHLIDMTRGPQFSTPMSIDAKMPPIAGSVGDAAKRRQETAASHSIDTARTGQPYQKEHAPLKHSASTGSLLPILKAADDVFGYSKEIRSLPPRVKAARHPKKMISKFIPLSGKANSTIERVVSTRRFGNLNHKSMLSRADQIPTGLGGNTQTFTRHTKQWAELSDIPNPPPTASGALLWTNQGCQTDDFLVFDETFEPLICEIVKGAINDARRTLIENEEFLRMEIENKELLEIVESQKQKNTELIQNIQQQSEAKKSLEAEKKTAEHVLDALEDRKLASEIMSKLTDSCFKRMMGRGIIKEDRFKKDVAADTRQLEKTSKVMKRMMREVERDFFPYVYQKAERAFIHSLTNSFLKDALFSNNDEFREDAHTKLNEKIAEYNLMMKRTKPLEEKSMLNGDYPPTEIIENVF